MVGVAVVMVVAVSLGVGLGVGLRLRNSTLMGSASFSQFSTEQEMREWVTRGWNEGFSRVWWNPGWTRWRGVCAPQRYYAMDAAASGSGSRSGSTNDYSGTNNQISGVDEGDTLKTDGTFVYQLVDQESSERNQWNSTYCEQHLVISQVYPVANASIVSRIVFPQTAASDFEAQEILLDVSSNTLAVLGTTDWTYVTVRIYDISDKTSPALIRTVMLEGDFLASRMINGNLYFVAGFWPGTRYYSYGTTYPTDSEWESTKALPPKLIPTFFDSARASDGYVPVAPVQEVGYISNVYAQQIITVSAFNVRERPSTFAPVSRSTAAIKGSMVMVSQYNVYVATSDWTDGSPNTVIARFEISGPKVAYRSIGQIEGILLNQFAIDEHEGNVRVASTRYTSGWRPSDNALWVLNSSMSTIGKASGIAAGEKIYSVRFSGNRGYMVTFVQTDPLFVMNLSDPTNPIIEGELKVPGVSDYLHIASEVSSVLIGAGRDQVSGSTQLTGVKLSTFGVQNVKAPTEISSYSVLPSSSSQYVSSDVGTDHKIFLYAPSPRNFVCLPFQVSNYQPYSRWLGTLVVSVASDWRLSEKGRISHLDQRYVNATTESYSYYEGIRIRRQLFINDLLYTVSNNVIEAHRIADLSKALRIIVGQRNASIDSSEVYRF